MTSLQKNRPVNKITIKKINNVTYNNDELESCPEIPLFKMVRGVFGNRLSYNFESGMWSVDGKIKTIPDIINVANAIQKKHGQNPFAYPNISTRYDYGLCGMSFAE